MAFIFFCKTMECTLDECQDYRIFLDAGCALAGQNAKAVSAAKQDKIAFTF